MVLNCVATFRMTEFRVFFGERVHSFFGLDKFLINRRFSGRFKSILASMAPWTAPPRFINHRSMRAWSCLRALGSFKRFKISFLSLPNVCSSAQAIFCCVQKAALHVSMAASFAKRAAPCWALRASSLAFCSASCLAFKAAALTAAALLAAVAFAAAYLRAAYRLAFAALALARALALLNQLPRGRTPSYVPLASSVVLHK